ncbi:MAG: hypothetical protein ACRETL_10865, partial [Gammaproteobacteria bacterium]
IVERVGLFDPLRTIMGSEDFILWLRIAKAGGRIAYHRKPILHYRRRPDSLTADGVGLAERVIRVFGRVKSTMDLTPSEEKLLTAKMALHKATLAWQLGGRAMAESDTDAAIRHWTDANQYFKTVKLTTMLAMLRISPGFFRGLYRFHHRRAPQRSPSH